MPQLDPTFFAAQLFWLAISFGLLYWLSAKVILPKVLAVVGAREQRISSDIDTAERFKNEALKVEKEYNELLKSNRETSRALVEKVRKEIASDAQQKHKELELFLQQKLLDSETKIQQSRHKALETVADISAELSVLIANKTAQISVRKEDAVKAVSEVADQESGASGASGAAVTKGRKHA